jgi:hypothetical protein
MADAFGNWIDDAQWDTVQLGGVFLPGVATVDRFADGLDIDVQKRRKKEKARLRDNGISPCAFIIKLELTAADWPKWVEVLPGIKPRRPGAIRRPMQIVHPLPNLHGVGDVYVKDIEYDAPSARAGMVIQIRVCEWFEEEKETLTSKSVYDPNGAGHKRLDPNDKSAPAEIYVAGKKAPVRNTDNMLDYSFKLNP